jgi:hypothetical protein
LPVLWFAATGAACAPVVPPLAGPPAVEPIDFYAMLGLTPMHLLKHDTGMPRTMMPYSPEETGAAEIVRPPTPEEIDAASYALQQATLLQPGLSPAEREARVRDLEIARRVLGNERLRSRYDGFWQAFHQGRFDHGHLEGLRALIEESARRRRTNLTCDPLARSGGSAAPAGTRTDRRQAAA